MHAEPRNQNKTFFSFLLIVDYCRNCSKSVLTAMNEASRGSGGLLLPAGGCNDIINISNIATSYHHA